MNEIVTIEKSEQYLSFKLRKEYFAVSINKVREVLDVTTSLTKIPRMPDYICGVINLRGSVLPVIDIGLRFGMQAIKLTINSCIIIVEIEVEGEDSKVEMGILADAVKEVMDLSVDDIEPTPVMGSGLNPEFIDGMGLQEDQFFILLDLEKVLIAEKEVVLHKPNDIVHVEQNSIV